MDRVAGGMVRRTVLMICKTPHGAHDMRDEIAYRTSRDGVCRQSEPGSRLERRASFTTKSSFAGFFSRSAPYDSL